MSCAARVSLLLLILRVRTTPERCHDTHFPVRRDTEAVSEDYHGDKDRIYCRTKDVSKV